MTDTTRCPKCGKLMERHSAGDYCYWECTSEICSPPDALDILRAENAQLRSENAMLRKMQPLVLKGDAARSFALATELSETKQALSALRADIEAENKPYTTEELLESNGKPIWIYFPEKNEGTWALLSLTKKGLQDQTVYVVVSSCTYRGIDLRNCGKTWMAYRNEQAARAAEENGNA